MVIYEVNLKLNPAIETEYLDWLEEHMDRMLKLPGFKNAFLYKAEATDDSNFVPYCVQYFVDSRDALQNYLDRHAPEMRQEASTKFGSQFYAERRILHSLEN
jgi:heme-degrading monooxygenase HmoA